MDRTTNRLFANAPAEHGPDATDSAVQQPPKAAPRLLVLLAATLVALVAALATRGDHADPRTEIVAPPLPVQTPQCQAPVETAYARGQHAESVALAKIARYPFAAAEGLPALALLGEAHSCYASSHAEARAAHIAIRKRAWQARLEQDYRAHLLRYERAIAAGRPELALRDIAFLLELLAPHAQAFCSHLRSVQRELETNTHKVDG